MRAQLATLDHVEERSMRILQKLYGYTKEQATIELDKHYSKVRLVRLSACVSRKPVVMVKTTDSQCLKNELLDMQRWENEGGKIIENNVLVRVSLQYLPVNPRRHDKSLEWNKRFVIEPFQPRNGILLTKKIHITKIE